MTFHRSVFLQLYISSFLVLFSFSSSQAQNNIPIAVDDIIQGFPTSGPQETQWKITWQIFPGKGLDISGVEFQPSPSSPSIPLLLEAGVGEIFVVYHDGVNRFFDLSVGASMVTLTDSDCPASQGGTLLMSFENPPRNIVCKQVRDRGLAWKDDASLRRGEELVLWSVLNAGNYNYIFEWTFRDDGTISSRVGFTGFNLIASPAEHHNHNVIWRLDFDLNGPQNDSAYIGKHSEIKEGALDTEELITKEVGFEWNPYEFTTLNIYDGNLTNGNGNSSSYRLIPKKEGLSRHQEDFTDFDFWVTAYEAGETDPVSLPGYLNRQNVAGTDIVVWYMDTFHHVTRDEDGQYLNGTFYPNVTLLEWVGFTLKPFNVFDKSPLTP